MTLPIQVCTPEEYGKVIALNNGFQCKILASQGVTAYVANGIKHVLHDAGWDAMMEGWDDQT